MKMVVNMNVRGRLAQVVIFVTSVLVCVLFSQVAEAQKRPGYNARFDKPKYTANVHKNSGKTCYALHKKRNAKPKNSMFAGLSRKSKSKAMAETDGPSAANTD